LTWIEKAGLLETNKIKAHEANRLLQETFERLIQIGVILEYLPEKLPLKDSARISVYLA